MFLGQLIYHEKELSKLSYSSSAVDLLDLDIAGVDKSYQQELRLLKDQNEMLLELKQHFIVGFEMKLKENNLSKSIDFWKRITSPMATNFPAIGRSNFQNAVEDWVGKNASMFSLWQNLLPEGKLITSEEDFAIYYGLHVLYTFNLYITKQEPTPDSERIVIDEKTEEGKQDLSTSPQIIVIGSLEIEPLLENINGVFIRNTLSSDLIVEAVLKSTKLHSQIRLVLIDERTKDIESELQKVNVADLIVVRVSFSKEAVGNYFDNLVRKTLGIKLTS